MLPETSSMTVDQDAIEPYSMSHHRALIKVYRRPLPISSTMSKLQLPPSERRNPHAPFKSLATRRNPGSTSTVLRTLKLSQLHPVGCLLLMSCGITSVPICRLLSTRHRLVCTPHVALGLILMFLMHVPQG